MNFSTCYCPNQKCSQYGLYGFGDNIIRRGFDNDVPRLKCNQCHGTFSARYGTAYFEIRAEKRIYTIGVRALAEGNSLRGASRIVEVDKDTISDWLNKAGRHCRTVTTYLFKNLHISECQLDELWSFVYKKEKCLTPAEKVLALYGDAWVWVAFAPEWRLVPAFVVGKREQVKANLLIDRLRSVSCEHIPFFTSDQWSQYPQALLYGYGNPEAT